MSWVKIKKEFDNDYFTEYGVAYEAFLVFKSGRLTLNVFNWGSHVFDTWTTSGAVFDLQDEISSYGSTAELHIYKKWKDGN